MNLPSSPVELFECFFDREILETFAEYSKTYARSKGNMAFSTTPDELQTFLAILLLSGYGPVPRRWMYWSSDEDVGKDCVQSAMSRNRFEEMLRYLHVSDNAHLDVGDKMSKVRPLLSHMNEKFLTYFRAVQTQNLSIDESMVPYYGRHSCKQFIRGKPIRFGYKVWMLSTSLGYLVKFEPYQSAKGRQAVYPGLGMGGSVVIDLIVALQEEEGRSYHLTFDNLFTSLNLWMCWQRRTSHAQEPYVQIALGIAQCVKSRRWRRQPGDPMTMPLTQPVALQLFDGTTTTSSTLSRIRWECTHFRLQSDGRGLNQSKSPFLSPSWSAITTAQWVVWIAQTRTLESTGQSFDARNGGGHYSLTVLTSACSRPGTCTRAQMLQKTTLWICLPSAGVSSVSTLPELALLHLVVLGDLCPLTSVSHQRSGMTVLIISSRAGQHSWDVEHLAKRRSVVVPNAKLAYTTSASSCTMLSETPESFTCTVSNMTVTFECWNHTRQLHSRQLEREHGQCYLLIIVTWLVDFCRFLLVTEINNVPNESFLVFLFVFCKKDCSLFQ